MLNTWSLVFCVMGLICIAIIAAMRAKRLCSSGSFKPFANTEAVHDLPEYKSIKRRYRLLIDVLMVSFLVTTGAVAVLAARPTKVVSLSPDYKTNDIMFCVDINSIDNHKKEQLKNFAESIKNYKGQRVGLTIFSGVYMNLSPLSDDYEALSNMFNDVVDNTEIYQKTLAQEQSKSEVGLGIFGCVKSFDKLGEENRSRYIILPTSNKNDESQVVSMSEAKNYAKQYDIEIHGLDLIESNVLTSAEEKISYQDNPSRTMIIAGISLVIMLLIIWRLGL